MRQWAVGIRQIGEESISFYCLLPTAYCLLPTAYSLTSPPSPPSDPTAAAAAAPWCAPSPPRSLGSA
ncbi:hypothetical protein EN858_16565 [Mesorhizobium sp. M4B.F.Ca.ET.215.01.1.1]|nr:hypothetical protein EOA34_01340 [Mesorhizobium sp. M4B.F.Ca.ET.013.02.1.1]TGQ10684.1 hypothetical protein EN858_16565 [Mesorhizobium sp. M4B.F.Ca.ET.215.01.1.1]TGQ36254.1 hypothetical protein EN857_17710 [Mesorhizobium sp. M4B.F.Ca.ET.214.01.1.1]TGQ38188.1 hypothetical protein EN863_026735 [Mesorhizobium sp. M00.F.Ca.ET.220.01.1.1]TGQ59056.1 hypothetical protein EN854_20445 [Mesorhizobium sp. M4B.F.Ca.ET.211.01.1.1]TGR03720.1 hypothetical protein EN846_16015 [Mesorhizobium sp. M4B.F.Ca.ET.